MTAVLDNLEAESLVAAIEANRFEFNRLAFGCWPKAEMLAGPHVLSYLTSIPFPLFNCIHGARLPADCLEAAIDEELEPFRARHVPMFWWTGPYTRPADLGQRLEAHGLVPVEDVPGMAMDLDEIAESSLRRSGFEIDRVHDLPPLER